MVRTHSLPGADENVHSVHLVHLKVVFVVFLPLGFAGILDDGLVAVDPVLFQLVGQHSLDGFAAVALGNLLNGVRDSVGLEEKERNRI